MAYSLYERFRPAWKASTRVEGACGCVAWPRALLWLGTAFICLGLARTQRQFTCRHSALASRCCAAGSVAPHTVRGWSANSQHLCPALPLGREGDPLALVPCFGSYRTGAPSHSCTWAPSAAWHTTGRRRRARSERQGDTTVQRCCSGGGRGGDSQTGPWRPATPWVHGGPIVNMCMLALLQRSCTKCIDRCIWTCRGIWAVGKSSPRCGPAWLASGCKDAGRLCQTRRSHALLPPPLAETTP